MGFNLAKVTVLEACPFFSKSALEDLAPSQGILFFYQAVKESRVFCFVEADVMEPCIKSV